jgi:hypothetical protein
MDPFRIGKLKEVTSVEEANSLLENGWVMLSHYVAETERPTYVLARSRSVREIVDVSEFDMNRKFSDDPCLSVNDYLQAGWLLVREYVRNYPDGPGDRNEYVHYVLGWFGEGQPIYPEKKEREEVKPI